MFFDCIFFLPQSQTEDGIRKELLALQEDKHNYETTTKETLRRVLQEKIEVVRKLAEVEVGTPSPSEPPLPRPVAALALGLTGGPVAAALAQQHGGRVHPPEGDVRKGPGGAPGAGQQVQRRRQRDQRAHRQNQGTAAPNSSSSWTFSRA